MVNPTYGINYIDQAGSPTNVFICWWGCLAGQYAIGHSEILFTLYNSKPFLE